MDISILEFKTILFDCKIRLQMITLICFYVLEDLNRLSLSTSIRNGYYLIFCISFIIVVYQVVFIKVFATAKTFIDKVLGFVVWGFTMHIFVYLLRDLHNIYPIFMIRLGYGLLILLILFLHTEVLKVSSFLLW